MSQGHVEEEWCGCDECIENEKAVSKSPSVDGYVKEDMVDFASWWYGPDIDCLGSKEQFECKTIEGALEYWLENVRVTAA